MSETDTYVNNGKRIYKASYSRKKYEDEMVTARQFEVNECKGITAEEERIMGRQQLIWRESV